MTARNNIKNILDGFVVFDNKQVLEKISRLTGDGSGKLHLITDFDRTLTIEKNKTNEDITTWHILNNHLPAAGQKRYRIFFNKYRPLEKENKLTVKDARVWWESTLQLFADYKVNLFDVENDFMKKIAIRPYSKKLFDFCGRKHIPTVILSAGIKDVIDLWAKNFTIKSSLVLSTRLNIDPGGTITGWVKNSLVHTLNKKEIGHPELVRIRRDRPNVILIGDALEDADMAQSTDRVLKIRINHPRKDNLTAARTFLKNTSGKFDLVAKTGTLSSVVKLVGLITG